jgi:hypothetical protein
VLPGGALGGFYWAGEGAHAPGDDGPWWHEGGGELKWGEEARWRGRY